MIKRSMSLLAALAVSLFAAQAQAATYEVDPAHSAIGFSVRHLMAKVPGSFKEFAGTFDFDEKSPDKSKAEFTVKAASIDTNNDKRDEHLRSPDFFDTAKHPEIKFVSKEVKKAGKNKFKLVGDLTMHGVTKPATFDVDYVGTMKDAWGNDKIGFAARTTVNRKDYGVLWNKSLDKGGAVLGDDVEITLDVQGAPKKVESEKK